jgi:hypothetical protein
VPADDEAVACGDNGLAVFERLGYRRQDARVFLYPFEARACRRGPRREPLETQGDADQLVPEELALAAALWRLPSSWVTRLAASLIASLLVSPQERRCRRRPRDFTDF